VVLGLNDEGQQVIVTSGVPVNLRVVLHKPCLSEDDSCLANTSDVEGGSFQMTLVLDNEVHDLGNVTGFVEGSFYVVDVDGSGEALIA